MAISPTRGAAGSRRPLPWLLLLLAVVVWYGMGFALQLLGPAPARSGTDAFLALPLTEGAPPLVAGALVGGALAGLLVLVAVPGRRGAAVVLTGLGVALALGVALGQSVLAVGADGQVPLLALELGLATLVAWGLGALGAAGRVWRGLALALVAAAVQTWWLFVGGTELVPETWAAAAVLAIALIAIGLRPPALALAWPVAVLLSWALAPLPLFTEAFNYNLEQGGDVGNSARFASDVSVQALLDLLTEGPGSWLPSAIAIATALVITLLLRPRGHDLQSREQLS